MVNKRTDSRSDVQGDAEGVILKKASELLGVDLSPRTIKINSATVKVDGYDENNGKVILAEVYAHQGSLKSAQRNKVYADILKLIFIKQFLKKDSIDAYIIFGDEEASGILKGVSWGSEVARLYGIKSLTVSLDTELREAIKTAQLKQDIRDIAS